MSSNVLEYNPVPRVLRPLGQWVVTGRDSGGNGIVTTGILQLTVLFLLQ